jgi:hypothetical protein
VLISFLASNLCLTLVPLLVWDIILLVLGYLKLGYWLGLIHGQCAFFTIVTQVFVTFQTMYLGTLVPVGTSEPRSSLLLIYALVLDSTGPF